MTSSGIPRLLVLALAALAMLWWRPAFAHPSGHSLAPGATLHIWTEPASRQPLPASLLFVRRDQVHVEDVAGRVHVWPVARLTDADRGLVDDFSRRVTALHPHRVPARRDTPVDGPGPDAPVALTWLAATSLVLFVVWRTGRSPRVLVRAAVALALCAVPLACGGRSTTAPSPTSGSTTPTGGTGTGAGTLTPLASYFAAFPAHVRTRQDADYLYVESDGMADHTMMVGITSWQQQVPIPAAYTGANAWRLPLAPRLAAQPVSARTGLFRGAIALAVNGVPIFNALNNRGDDAFLAGELDDFGGHAGRADDYHYHTAPLFLSNTVGATRPIGVALDGFLLYGSLEPDGSPMRALDDYNGHADPAETYHYHGTRTYPYINGGMKGVVTVSDQVEPQPSLQPVRPAGTPLRDAVITRHQATGTSAWTLEYRLQNQTYRVDYRVEGSRTTFVFTDASGASRTEVYGR